MQTCFGFTADSVSRLISTDNFPDIKFAAFARGRGRACTRRLLDNKIISTGQFAALAQSSGLSLSANISVLRAAEANTVRQSRWCQVGLQRSESAEFRINTIKQIYSEKPKHI